MSDAADWWRTAIIDMAPGEIRLRGRPIETLIGAVTFPQMIWLMTRGELPGEGQARLLEAALTAAVDHGPQAPSIAAARMAVTCGLGLNGAMATAVHMLDDVHGGAGEQALELYGWMAAEGGASAAEAVDRWQAERGRYLPGFGHRFHTPQDPRAPRLMALIAEAAEAGLVEGRHGAAAQAVEAELAARRGKPVPMNIDGATAAVY
ncbi:MAG: citryl-CoA lyase, partial [Pseudomonadota bacterium]